MPTKLTNLKITKVDFVDAGANPQANVLLSKSREGKPVTPPKPEEIPVLLPEPEGIFQKVMGAVKKALGLDGEGADPENFTILPASQAELPKPEKPQDMPDEKLQGAEDLKIDKSKMTNEERAALEELEKKYGLPDEPPAQEAKVTKKQDVPPEDGGDIYKGLHPAVKAELERLRKQADTMEERELQEVAKKYEIIGKKADELVPTLKSLKAAGGDAYDQMIAVLDASVATVEKSGLFTEVGKRGTSGGSDAWAAIEKHAETIQKSAPSMTWNQAVDKACEQHPDLVHDYESNR